MRGCDRRVILDIDMYQKGTILLIVSPQIKIIARFVTLVHRFLFKYHNIMRHDRIIYTYTITIYIYHNYLQVSDPTIPMSHTVSNHAHKSLLFGVFSLILYDTSRSQFTPASPFVGLSLYQPHIENQKGPHFYYTFFRRKAHVSFTTTTFQVCSVPLLMMISIMIVVVSTARFQSFATFNNQMIKQSSLHSWRVG